MWLCGSPVGRITRVGARVRHMRIEAAVRQSSTEPIANCAPAPSTSFVFVVVCVTTQTVLGQDKFESASVLLEWSETFDYFVANAITSKRAN